MNKAEQEITVIPYADMWAVSAQSLHYYLGDKRPYSAWLRDLIKDSPFVEHEDYYIVPRWVGDGDDLHPTEDALLTLRVVFYILADTKDQEAWDYIDTFDSKPVPVSAPTTDFSTLPMGEFIDAFSQALHDNHGVNPTNYFAYVKAATLSGDYEVEKPRQKLWNLLQSYPSSKECCMTVSQLAGQYETTAGELNKALERCGLQERVGGKWEMCDRFKPQQDQLKDGDKWTPRGQYLVFCTLISLGWRPMVSSNYDDILFLFEVAYYTSKRVMEQKQKLN